MPGSLITIAAPAAIDAGTYPVVLTGIEEKTITVQGENVDGFEWTFNVNVEVEDDEEPIPPIRRFTSKATGPRSKVSEFLTALVGADSVAVGAEFGPDDLIGREALATIIISDSGWPKIESLTAMPRKGRKVRDAVVAADVADDEVPF